MEEQTKKQKQKEIMRLMEAWLEDGSNSHQTALGFIRADIKERGFEGWLNMDAEMLDDIGVEQTMRIDQHDLLIGFRKGMLDIFKSLVIYFDAKQQAEHQYEDCRG
jgi:hypothetical protein